MACTDKHIAAPYRLSLFWPALKRDRCVCPVDIDVYINVRDNGAAIPTV